MGTSTSFPGPLGERWRTARGHQTAWLQGKGDWDIGTVAAGYLAAVRAGSRDADSPGWPELREATANAAAALVGTADEISRSGPAAVAGECLLGTRAASTEDKLATAIADRVAGPGNRHVDVIMRTAALRTARLLHAECPSLRDELRYVERAAGEGDGAALRASRARPISFLDDETLGVLLRSFFAEVLSETLLALAAERLCVGFPGAAAIAQEAAMREWARKETARLVPDPRRVRRTQQPGTGLPEPAPAEVARDLVPEAVRGLWGDGGSTEQAHTATTPGETAGDTARDTAGNAAGDDATTEAVRPAGEATGWTPATGVSGTAAHTRRPTAVSGASTTRSGVPSGSRRAGRR